LTFVLYLLIGAVAGVLAGLFGVGGGIIIVPVLIFSFSAQLFPEQILTHLAVGTSLATIIVTSVSSVIAHHQRAAVDWPLFWRFAPAICIGVWLGVKTASGLSGSFLQQSFGVFAVVVGLQMATGFMPGGHRPLPSNTGLFCVAGIIGWCSALFGIGGGSLTVPFLSWCNIQMQRAVATSAAIGIPIALVGAISNIIEGWGRPELPEWSIGFVYLPAALGMVISSAIFARFGAKLAHSLPAARLKQIFGLFLILIGLYLVIRVLIRVFVG